MDFWHYTKIPFMFRQKSTQSRDRWRNVKKFFHKQGEYNESCPVHYSHFFRVFVPFCTLLFHSMFKVEFYIDHFVLGEHRER